ncbi:SPOCS domain-containing protein [Virgibacillus halodenitrificans]|uniref:SPOCS domain-containing protein n=1 Tax=Virgibacillus halodenitrificans TaxID=1482 RepID=UPI00045CDB45|nr:SPOCS domain-containing protein [Virgibacillus halodenitrificans]CDQ31211.1 hypothetical protein BN993_00586 [Virgibacillus halodenitrificans]
MELYSQLLGIGDNGEVLTAIIDVEILPNSNEAVFMVTNTSPSLPSETNFNIRQVFFNTGQLPIRIKKITQANNASNFNIHKQENMEKDFEYLIEDNTDRGLRPNEKLICTIELDSEEGSEGQSWLHAPLTSINKGIGVQVAATFYNDKGEEADKIGGHYKCRQKKKKYPKPTPPVTTTPSPRPCPVANPQSCCQIIIERKTQLVPPALFNPDRPEQYPVTHKKTFDVAIEKVCPEKVIICGTVHKTIYYKTLKKDCSGDTSIIDHYVKDDIPFQCFIDRDDANENDEFEIVGAAFLCDVFDTPKNFGYHPEFSQYPVAWKFEEKEILKVCIRKVQ